MKYYISIIHKTDPNKEEILGEYDDLETAVSAGEQFDETAARGDVISCIRANLDENNNIIGKYFLYKCWQ